MPRNQGKKGITDQDDFFVDIKLEEQQIDQPELVAFIEQLQTDHSFWKRKGHKLRCTLCSINVQFSSFSIFKTEIKAHMKSKRHKKKFEFYKDARDYEKTSEVIVKSENEGSEQIAEIIKNEKEDDEKGTNDNLSDLIREVEYQLSNEEEITNKKNTIRHHLVDLDSVFCSLEKENPVTQISKKYIQKAKDGRNYFCTICQEIIFESLNANEFKYNVWTHINHVNHRNKLPNFPKVEKGFENLMRKLSRKLPSDLKGDLKYFEIGPVFRFVKCSLCNVAVSNNLYRLQNHIEKLSHQNRKHSEPNKYSQRSVNNHTCNCYSSFILQLETELEQFDLKEDIKFVHIGSIAGYVVCSLCSEVVIPTLHYMKIHFKSDNHVKNRLGNLIKWESAQKANEIEKLQDNLIDHSLFEETKFGIKCHKCCRTFPKTSYALYIHIKNKPGCVNRHDK